MSTEPEPQADAVSTRDSPPESYAVGDNINWASPLVDVQLVMELPFWMMMPTSIVDIEHNGGIFKLLVSEQDYEVFAGSVTDNRRSCGYQGPQPELFESREDIQALGLPLMRRKQRTTVYFKSRCHEDVQEALFDRDRYRVAIFYLASLCEAHIPVLNELIDRYRLLTYDYFAYEVSAWDVPVWHVRGGPRGHVSVPLFDYMSIEARPMIYPNLLKESVEEEKRRESYPLELVNGEQLEASNASSATPGERDLLDARNLMERGDYNGAIRRTTTAIEVLVGHVLRTELLKSYDSETVDVKLEASRNDFPGRLRQWQRISGVTLPESRLRSIEEIRSLRHEIVHRGRRLSFVERGLAQRLTDTGRWTFNHIERDVVKRDLREKNNVVRSMLRPTLALRFPVVNTPHGFEVKSFRSEFEGMGDSS